MGQSRSEDIIENILGAENELEPPQSRIEVLLMQLLESGGGDLPVASTTTLGGVKVDGETIGIDENGVISIALDSADSVSY